MNNTFLREHLLTLATPDEVPEPQQMRFVSVAELESMPDLAWCVDGYFPAGGLGVIYGRSGIGKSIFAMGLAFSVASGLPWLGHSVLRGHVIYVDGDGRSGLRQRAKAWRQVNPGANLDGVHFIMEPVRFMEPAVIEILKKALGTLPEYPVLIVIDTLARCLIGADENSSRDVGAFIAGVDRIRSETGAAVIILHHTGKAGTVERGSSALRAAADTMVSLTADGDILSLEVDKQKDGPLPERMHLRLALIPDTKSCVVEVAEAAHRRKQLSVNQRKALESLASLPGGRNYTQWQVACRLPQATFYRASKVLVDSGHVVASGQGRSKTYSLTDQGMDAFTFTLPP